MPTEFDNDEIQDSPFPVNFSDVQPALDMYGVWVKSGPRDVSATDAEPTNLSGQFSSDFQDLPKMEDFTDISDLPDLPDLSDFNTENGIPEEPMIDITENFLSKDVITDTVEDITTQFLDDETVSFYNPVFTDLPSDTARTETEPAIPDTLPDFDADMISVSDFDISVNDLSTEEVPEEIPEEMELPSASADINSPEKEIDLADFITDFSENMSTSESSDVIVHEEVLPSDDDFSSFLDDLNTSTPEQSSSTSTETGDLDDFINAFNEGGVFVVSPEKEQIYEETDPVDLDLDFDEDFIADAEMIKASGTTVSESEFMSSEFGVELIDETPVFNTSEFVAQSSSDATSDTFDDMFSDVSSEKKPAIATDSGNEGMVAATEFDDLLQSLENNMSPAAAPTKSTRAITGPTFDLVVTEDDTGAEVSSTAIADNSGEDVSVPLFGEIGGKNEENLAINSITDYNNANEETDLSGFMSPDFDDISAVEKELNDFTPETGDEEVFNNDKSTELLMQIAKELSSIKTEISTLKTELSNYKNATSGTTVNESPDTITDGSGFFTDDDPDEAIALTGDELNNILITADFTEEKNEETGVTTDVASEVSDLSIPENLDDFMPEMSDSDFLQNFSEESPEIIVEEATPEIVLEENEIPEILPDSIFDIPDLSVNEAIQVSPVTQVEGDMSYLEESDVTVSDMNDVAIEEPELEIIDFDDEKLEEPELAEFNIDLTEFEDTIPSEQEVSIPEEEVLEEPEISPSTGVSALPIELKSEIKSVLTYMDQLLESLPEEKIEEFAKSEHFEVYKKLFEELGIS